MRIMSVYFRRCPEPMSDGRAWAIDSSHEYDVRPVGNRSSRAWLECSESIRHERVVVVRRDNVLDVRSIEAIGPDAHVEWSSCIGNREGCSWLM